MVVLPEHGRARWEEAKSAQKVSIQRAHLRVICYVFTTLRCYTEILRLTQYTMLMWACAVPLENLSTHSVFTLSLASASRAPGPHTNSSTSLFPPVKLSSVPKTGVNNGTNIATRVRYAA